MLSLEAQVTYSRAYFLAAKCQCDGRLISNGSALGIEALYNAKIPQAKLSRVLQELSHQTDHDGAPWVLQLLDGTFDVPGWRVDQFIGKANAARQQRYRERYSNGQSNGYSNAQEAMRYSNGLDNIGIPSPGSKDPSEGTGSKKSTRYSNGRNNAPEWPPVLTAAFESIRKKELRALGPDELDTLGRYHCLVYGNCTKDEMRNRTLGQRVAAQLASLARIRDYADITAGEYIAYGKKVHERRGGRPWYEPFLIKAEVEFEASR